MVDRVTAPRRTGSGLRLTLLAMANLIISVDYNIVYVALPVIGREVGFSSQSLQWVVSAYAVGFGGFLLLGGRASDRIGPRRIFIAGTAIFGFASLAGGLAPSAGFLVAARVSQGLGAALLFPSTLALIGTGFDEGRYRNRALSVWGVAGASGAVVGPVIGGALTNYLGWQSVFFVNGPITLAVAFGAVALVAPDGPPKLGRGFDVLGALVVTAGATLVVLGLVSGTEVGWRSAHASGALVVGVALLGTFLYIERRSSNPLVPPQMLLIRSLFVAVAVIFLFMATVNTLHYLFFIYLQDVLGFSAFDAGLAFLPMSLLAIVGSWKLLPALLNRYGLRATLLTGLLGAGVAMATIASGMSPDGSYGLLLPGIMLLGLFAGMVYPAMFAAAGAGVDAGQHGVASALTSTSQQIGGAVGLAALLGVANAGLEQGAPLAATADVVDGLRMAGLVASALTIAGAAITLLIREPAPARTRNAEVSPADDLVTCSP